MRIEKAILTGLLGLIIHLPGFVAADELNFSHISTQNGLSQNTVRAIVEDKKGFIWAGTLDGLIRYDGYNIQTYRPHAGNPNSLPDHRIKDMFVDKNGYIWIKTYKNEFRCYDPVADSFYDYTPVDGNGQKVSFTNYYESSRGDIWLWGNYAGLLRVRKKEEGFSGTRFLHDADGEKSCCFLFEDSQGAIWAGGETGLYKITDAETPEAFHTEGNIPAFTCAAELNEKIYFTAAESKLMVYDMKRGSFEQIDYLAANVSFHTIATLSDSELLILTQSSGLLTFNIHTGQFGKPEWSGAQEISGDIRLITDKNKGLWIYNYSGLAWYYNHASGKIKQMRLIPENIAKTVDLERYFIFIDSKDLIWIATYGNGLFCYEPAKDMLTNYRNMPDKNSLTSDYLLSITEDTYGNIWLGSEYAGIIRIVKTPEYLRIIRPEAETSLGKNNNVRTICEDSHGNIWVGTKNGSLYIYDNSLTAGKCIGKNLNPYALAEDKKQRMWIGTKGNGLYLYDTGKNSEITRYKHDRNDPASLSNDMIFHVMTDTKDRVWIASFFGGGINLLNEYPGGKSTFTRFIQDEGDRSNIRCLYQDSRGMIWAGSRDGLIRFYPDELIENPEAYTLCTADANTPGSLSSNDIKTIYEDSDHTVWIGTAGGGINRFVCRTPEREEYFVSYTTENGLADNFVSGILEHDGCLWISSENGISRFDRKNEHFMTYHFSEKTYGNNFNENAFAKCRNGNMLWGSLDGLLLFNPDAFRPQKQSPPVSLTGIQIEGADDNKSIQKNTITYTDHIKLNYRQNTFTINFATLILRNPAKNRYTYILENYDKRWSAVTHLNMATYKNLPHGKYVFKVKGANHDGIWNDEITELRIIITPPWWKSVYAYAFYILLGLFALYTTFYIIRKFNRLNNAVNIEKQLTNHKLRFFTNISHEFRTPLTLIRGVIENLSEENNIPPAVSKQISVLSRNSDSLTRLIDQLLEFRKIQNNVLTLNLEETDIVDFTKEIYSGFQEIACRKHIDYIFTSETDSFPLFIDRKKIDKILYNLLSNAFKFTPDGGRIELTLAIDRKNESCSIHVKDNGIGIPKEKQHLLFSRFMQINLSSSGTGIGLSLVKEFAEVHKGKVGFENNPEGGSIFYLELPTAKETYKDANFISPSRPPDTAKNKAMPTPPAAHIRHETPAIDHAILSAYKMLIIDDNDDLRNFLTDEFSKYLSVDVAEDGKKGVLKAIELNPDLIICDVMMPEMDGFEVTKQLKKEFQTCHIPIILLTAHSSIEHQLEGIESGADAYITKPFSLKYIVKRVMKLIEQREQLKKRFAHDKTLDSSLITSTGKDKVFLERIESILEKQYADSEFTVEKFAALINMRRTIFYKKVKGITGFSPNELIKLKRLKEASLLILEGKLNVSEVAYKVGFEDPLYFSKCFKAHFNCSPSKYAHQTTCATHPS
ncbi:MAG: response regulator [Tannerellaceae bacterium]|jgi:signal transduction histidine kinase/ligand-binding sensor domain-containing protein/DNA-binding response OmpR family regulator|nr:response regulator [Tannerellaceae bacterium]